MLNVSDLGEKIRSLVRRMMQLERWHAFGLIETYDPVSHKATVCLMPDGAMTPPIPVLVPWLGVRQSPVQGTQCKVLIDRDRADSVIGVAYSASDPLPAAGLAMEGDVYLGGLVTIAKGLMLTRVPALPPVTIDNRGEMIVLTQTSDFAVGPADGLYIALQNAAGAMVWWYAGGP